MENFLPRNSARRTFAVIYLSRQRNIVLWNCGRKLENDSRDFFVLLKSGENAIGTQTKCRDSRVLGGVQYSSFDEFVPYNISASRLLIIFRMRNSETGNALTRPRHVEHACVHYARTKIATSDRSTRISRLDIYRTPQVIPIEFNAFECVSLMSHYKSLFRSFRQTAVDLTDFSFFRHVKICFEIHLSSGITNIPLFIIRYNFLKMDRPSTWKCGRPDRSWSI